MNDHDDEPRSANRSELSKISGRSDPDAHSLTCRIYSFESFEYSPGQDTYQALFDPDEIDPSEAIIGVISEAEDVDPLDVEQLSSKTDVDALNSLLGTRRPFEGDVHVSFRIHGYDVSLSSYGSIVARPHVPPST